MLRFKPLKICLVDVKLTDSVNRRSFHQIDVAVHYIISMLLYPPKFVLFFTVHYLKSTPSGDIQKCKLSTNGRWF